MKQSSADSREIRSRVAWQNSPLADSMKSFQSRADATEKVDAPLKYPRSCVDFMTEIYHMGGGRQEFSMRSSFCKKRPTKVTPTLNDENNLKIESKSTFFIAL